MVDGITWFKQSAVRIRRAGQTIYIDPWGITRKEEADYVFLTHPHYDHFDRKDLDKVVGKKTVLVVPTSMAPEVPRANHTVEPGEELMLLGVELRAVAAYNVGKSFHPKEKKWVGYRLKLGDRTYYHAGDTDYIEEMKELEADVAFLPCGGTYTTGPEDAARAAKAVRAKVVVPFHWGDVVGSRADAERVASLCKDAEVRILERGKEY